ncbi:MAG: PAS domain S-box protein [Victivallales bacterium]
MSLRMKLTLMFLAIAIIPLFFVNAMIFHNYKDSIEASRINALKDIAVYKASKIEDFFKEMKQFMGIAQEAHVFKQNFPVLNRLEIKTGSKEFIAIRGIIDPPIQNMQKIIGLVDIMLVSPEGRIVYSSNPDHQFKDYGKTLPDACRGTYDEGSSKIHFSEVFMNKMNHNRPGMLIAGPVLDSGKNFIGEVVFEADIEIMYKLVLEQAGLGNTGEALLVKKEEGNVVFLNPLKFDSNAAFNRKIKIGDKIGIPAQEAVQGRNGAGTSIDYRGEKVIAAWRSIPELGWGVVAKVDAEEAFADAANLEKLVMIVLLIVSLLAGIMAFSVAKSISDPIQKLSEGAKMIGAGSLDFRVGTGQNDEIGQLSRTFDKMVLDLKTTTASRDELNREIAERRHAEDSLRESEKKYRRLFETITEGIVYQDQDGRITDMNPAAERILGKTMQEFLGRASELAEDGCIREDGTIFPGTEHPAMVALRSGQIVRNKIMGIYNPREKMRRWIEIAAVPLFQPGAELPCQVYAVFSDVTSRKRFEDALRDSEMFLNETQRIARFGGWKVNPNTDMLEWSSSIYEILEAPRGYRPSVLVDIELYLPEYIPLLQEKVARCMDTGEGFILECRLKTFTGRLLWAELRGLKRVVEGENTYVMGTFQDITERKRAEQVLRESQADLNRAQTVAQVGSWRLDVQKNELVWSDENHRIFGIPEGTEMTYETFLGMIHPDDVLHVDQRWKDALKGEPYDVEHRIIIAGKIKWIRERAELEFDGKGALLGGFGTSQDISERKNREDELSRLNRTLKALSHSNQAMMRANNETEYIKEVCRIIVEDCGYKMVWIGFSENDEKKTVHPVASAGFEEGYLETLNITWADTELGRGPTGTAIRTGEICYCRNMLTDPKFGPWRKEAVKRGYASSVVLPLMDGNRAFGAINIYSKEPDSFFESEMNLISELVGDLAHGIMELRLRKLHAQTEQALIKSERRYRTLFDGMTEGFALHEIICNVDGRPIDYRFLEVNPAFERLTGLKRRDVLYMTHNEILHDDDPKWVEIYGKVALTGEPVEFENYSPALKKHFQVLAYSPAPKQFAVIFMDVSERKKAEAELRLSERRQSILSYSAAAMLQAVDPQEIIDEVCRRTMESLDCQVFFNFLFVEERNKLRLNAYSGIPEDEARRIEWIDFGVAVCGCVARDGERIIAEDIPKTKDPRTDLVSGYGVRAYCCHPLKTGEGVLGTISFGTTNRDKFTEDEILMMKSTAELVTVALQRKEWERKLVESEERLRLAQISANIGVWEWNPQNGRFISTPELSRLYGESQYTITKYQDLQRKVHSDDIVKFEKNRREAIVSRRAFDLEFRINYADDEIRWLSSKGGAVYDENGEVLRVFGVNADITVRKMAEEILKRDKETLANIVKERSAKLLDIQTELDRAKRLSDIGTLASTVAHELRNPLAAITMSAAIIKRKSKSEVVEGQLRNIDKMVTESDQIINNLLFYSRLRSPHLESIDICVIMDECVENLCRQVKRTIYFKRSYEPLRDVMISADPLQMKEVFHNLLHNAADAVPDNCGEVEILAGDYPESIKIHVKDNGHGIDASHMEKIFDPFFTTKAKGTGLGLTVCNQVVNMHGGSIDVKSEPGKGTTMTITLPKKEKGK